MQSEFASLLDLVIRQGMNHSLILEEIHAAVLESFKTRYPKGPIGIRIFVDEVTGDVRLILGSKDVTPPAFLPEAARIARSVLIGKLGNPPVPEIRSVKTGPPDSGFSGHFKAYVSNIFFFGYNIYFLLFLGLFAFSAMVSGGTGFVDVLRGLPFFKVLLLVTGIGIPPLSIAIAVKNRLYDAPGKLGQLFFLFELPVIFTVFVVSTVLTYYPPVLIIVIVSAIATPVLLYISTAGADVPVLVQKILLIIHQSVTLIGGYAVFLFSFYIPVILAGIMNLLFSDMFVRFGSSGNYGYRGGFVPPPVSVIDLLLRFSVGFFIVLVVCVAISMPFVFVFRLMESFSALRRKLLPAWPEQTMLIYQSVFAAFLVIVILVFAYPGNELKQLKLLQSVSKSTVFEQREDAARRILPYEQTLKTLLQNQANGKRPYLFNSGSHDLADMYTSLLHVSPGTALVIQKMFLAAAYPFVFQGDTSDGTLYTNFQYVFGYPYYSDRTGISPESNPTVLLSSRKIRVTPYPDKLTAEISVDEEYENLQYREQEIVYEFSLPQGSAVVGLKLGPDLEFPGVIAPRGAAQKTYEQQMQRRRDPALLEQTGPHAYRLRIFPIPAKGDFNTLNGKRQRVQFRYIVPAGDKGFALPEYTRTQNVQITDAANIFFVKGTDAYRLDRKNAYISFAQAGGGSWCSGSDPVREVAFTDSLKARIVPYTSDARTKNIACGGPDFAFNAVRGKTIAIIADISAGNTSGQIAAEITRELTDHTNFIENNRIDVYKANDLLSAPVRLTKNSVRDALSFTVFGTGSILNTLQKVTTNYQAVFVITNTRTMTLGNNMYPFGRATRVYFIHPEHQAAYSADLTQKILSSGGGSAHTLTDAVRAFALETVRGDTANTISAGGLLSVEFSGLPPELAVGGSVQLPKPIDAAAAPGLIALVNKAFVDVVARVYPKDITGDISLSDTVNNFSASAGIVTNVSSYIALVNEQQMRTLEQFKREFSRYESRPTDAFMPPPMPVPVTGGVFSQRGILSLPSMGVETIGGSLNLPRPYDGSPQVNISGQESLKIQNLGMSGVALLSSSGGPVIWFVAGNGILLIIGGLYMLLKSFRIPKKPRTN